eukprot:CAMPEP_0198297058 /NCGR_PEP_ID=MMETSP1449-20131203/35217_1 /TAXON_ID=420275 /ORGANISM="Attheya septentrionalis, Strain CCMP2084" /LENGTH=167 /DNA_ID=CAMNT_0043997867 /DNA_START=123 /DNA_END=622 /DNA_ORIENTATION=+
MRLPCNNCSMRSVLGRMPTTQFSVNAAHASPIRRAEFKTLAVIIGLNTLSSKCPWAPPIVTATLFPMTWAQTMVIASHWVGFTFPGMMEEPGSFSGSAISPSPHRGPLPSNRMSLAILFKLVATTLSAPESSTKESCAASASNLEGAVTKGNPDSFAIAEAIAVSYP